MTPFALIALFGWPIAVLVMYAMMPSRQAAIVAVIGAWLVLPPYVIPISSFPDFSKNTAATIGMLLGTLFFAPERLLAFRPRWFDLPMVGWCLSGVAASLHNDLGLYDGLSDGLNQALYWGLPYFFGRMYFGDSEGLRGFTVAMVIGGLAYVLPCIWEMRMSPHLLADVYGFAGWEGTRLGGFRPRIFFKTGLECGLWMTAVSLTAWWLWRTKVLTSLGGVPFGAVILPILMFTTVLCRSTGALVLLSGGIFILTMSPRFRTRLFLLALALVPPVYVFVRTRDLWSGQELVGLVRTYFDPQRAQSLEYRLQCEELLLARALQEPVYGWGGWDRARVYFDENYRDVAHAVPVDGLWIGTLASKGFVGLCLLYVSMELPVVVFLCALRPSLWRHRLVAPAALAATLIGLYMIDCLLNGFVNIIYVTLAGGLISFKPPRLDKASRRMPPRAPQLNPLVVHAATRRSPPRARQRGRPGRPVLRPGPQLEESRED